MRKLWRKSCGCWCYLQLADPAKIGEEIRNLQSLPKKVAHSICTHSGEAVKLKLGTDFNISFDAVPIGALVHPLYVIPDCFGDSNIYFIVLPKCNSSRFFGERIIITTHINQPVGIIVKNKNIQAQLT